MKFTRTKPAPSISDGYQEFRPYVRNDFQQTCAYCLVHELLAAGEENFELDHFKPASKCKALRDDFYNLYYSCHPCNHIKRAKWPDDRLIDKGVGFVDLCKDDFENHFRELADGCWEGLTESARYTIDALRLNRRHLKQIRLLVKSQSKWQPFT
jgi:hypothetical protein